MLEVLQTAVGAVLAVWGVALVHQFGHYLAGWRIVGIPRSEMRLVTLLVPRYVALRVGDEERDETTEDETSADAKWVSPMAFDRFRAAYERHDPRYEHFERFVAGGEIVQVLVLVPVAIVLALAGFSTPAAILLGASIATTFVFVVVDAVRTRQSDGPSGDYSALWPVSRRLPALLLLAFFFVHLGAIYFVV